MTLSCLFNTHHKNGALSILPLSVSYDRNIGGTSGGGPLTHFGRNITTEIRRANRFFATLIQSSDPFFRGAKELKEERGSEMFATTKGGGGGGGLGEGS